MISNRSDPIATPDPAAAANRPMPVVVVRMLLFFYLFGWVALVADTYIAVSNTTDGHWGFLLPVALYGLLLVSPVFYNARQHRRVGGNWADHLWGYDDQLRRQVAFILLSFGLIAWMTALVPQVYGWFYIALWAQTLGMFRWRIAVPLVVGQLAVWLYQVGWVAGFFAARGPSVVAIGTAIGVAFFFVYATLIAILLKSQVRSEKLVQELRATQRRLEEALAHEREAAVLRERNRMAREMHDVLGHALVLVAVKIEAAQRLQAVDPARAAAELDATKDLVRQSMADLRASLAELRSPALEPGIQPLGAVLQTWAAHIGREAGVAVRSQFAPELDTLPLPIQDALWRVGREAVLNVVKHAQARHVELNLFCKDSTAFLSVADDGVGIPHLAGGQARLEVAGHYGIRGMRERLEALGGHLAIRPARDGQGTLLLASVPLPPPAPPLAPGLRTRLAPARRLLVRKEPPS